MRLWNNDLDITETVYLLYNNYPNKFLHNDYMCPAELLAQAGVSNTFVVRGGMGGEIGSADNTGWKAQMLPTDVLAAI